MKIRVGSCSGETVEIEDTELEQYLRELGVKPRWRRKSATDEAYCTVCELSYPLVCPKCQTQHRRCVVCGKPLRVRLPPGSVGGERYISVSESEESG